MSKKLFLAVLPLLALAMASCSRGNGGASSGGGSSKDPGTSSQSSQASDSSADDSSADDSSADDSSAGGGGQAFTVYFKDASWWNKDAAATYISVDDGEAVAMTYDSVHGYDPVGKFNYWSYELSADATKVVFQRWGTNTSTSETSYWGAKTVEITLADRNEYNMYDISGTEAAWEGDGNFVTGTWGTYPAE